MTWHWTGGRALDKARTALTGGRGPTISAHYCVGRSYADGVDRYVKLEHRSGHCGRGQSVRDDGLPLGGDADKASRRTIGIETVNRGQSRAGVAAQPDWLHVLGDNHQRYAVEPWTDEQLEMMIAVGKEIQATHTHLRPRNHHGHLDLAPGRKLDPCGLDFTRILRGIYDDATIPDVWTPFHRVRPRQYALFRLGFMDESSVTGVISRKLTTAVSTYQTSKNLASNGRWNTMTAWAIHDDLLAMNIRLDGPEFMALAADPTSSSRRTGRRSARARHG